MEFELSRLRRGEWIAIAGAALLLLSTFALHWYGPSSQVGSTSVNGWQGLTHLRWLVVVTVIAALGLAGLQTMRRAPALPVTMSVILTVVALVTVLLLGYKVLISPRPNQKAGAIVGLLGACVILYGGYQSMRAEGISSKDERHEIPTVQPQAPAE